MRVVFVLLALALAACAPRQQAGCDLSLTRDLSFSSAEAADRVTVRTLGPTCPQAIVVYAIHAEDGHPLWAWTAPVPLAFGEVFHDADADIMRAFLERWAQPHLTTTSEAPDFALLAQGQSTLDQLTYDDIRARNLPMLCHLSGTSRETCVFWEPAAGGAGHFYDRDADIPESEP